MFDAADLINAFRASGSWIDEGAMAIAPVDGMGMGAIAKRDIEVSYPLPYMHLYGIFVPNCRPIHHCSTSHRHTSSHHGHRASETTCPKPSGIASKAAGPA